MSDLATLQQRLEHLRELRADGVRRARFGEDEMEFRSDTELQAAIADIERQIASLNQPRRLFVVRTSKGF